MSHSSAWHLGCNVGCLTHRNQVHQLVHFEECLLPGHPNVRFHKDTLLTFLFIVYISLLWDERIKSEPLSTCHGGTSSCHDDTKMRCVCLDSRRGILTQRDLDIICKDALLIWIVLQATLSLINVIFVFCNLDFLEALLKQSLLLKYSAQRQAVVFI